MATFHRLIYGLNNNETEYTLITGKSKDLLKAYLGGLKKKTVQCSLVCLQVRHKYLRRIELNSHFFSEHALVRLLFNFNAKNIHTFVN